jgi:DNA polymerase-3 subunit epsilon
MVDRICEWAHQRMEKKDFIVLDTETTSLDGEVIDLAILDAEGKVLFDSLIKPMERVTAEARAIHHISDEMLARAPSFAEVWQTIAPLFEDPKQHIITYNAAFDRCMLLNSVCAAGLDAISLKGTWSCLMDRYMRHIGRSRWQKLEEALRQQKLPASNTHRALADAQAAYSLLACLAAKHEQIETEKAQPLTSHLGDSSLIGGQQFKRIIGAQDEMLEYPSARTEPLVLEQ